MAQGPSQQRMGKTAESAKEILQSPTLPSLSSFTSTQSKGISAEAEEKTLPPAINVLLVHVKHLQQWLPSNALVRPPVKFGCCSVYSILRHALASLLASTAFSEAGTSSHYAPAKVLTQLCACTTADNAQCGHQLLHDNRC